MERLKITNEGLSKGLKTLKDHLKRTQTTTNDGDSSYWKQLVFIDDINSSIQKQHQKIESAREVCAPLEMHQNVMECDDHAAQDDC